MRDIKLIGSLLKRNAILLAVCMGIGLGLGAWKVYRFQALYQASATLMLNDKESGASKFMKSFESFSVTGKLLTEVEVLRSRYLIGKTLDKLNVNIPISKSVRGEWRELYQRSPFSIQLDIIDPTFADKAFDMTYKQDGNFSLSVLKNGVPVLFTGKIEETLSTPAFNLCISPNTTYLQEAPTALRAGLYRFEYISRERLIDHYSGQALTIKLIDKEVAVVKVYFRHAVPLKAQHFVNTLLACYLDDFITNKTEAANKALGFISKELNTVSSELRSSEQKIAAFKQSEGITELSLEADDRLKKLRERELQRTTLAMEFAEIERLSKALIASNASKALAGELGVVGHVACQRALEKLQNLEAKRAELLQTFTALHPDVQLIDDNILTARLALTETVGNTLAGHLEKMRELETSIKEIEEKIQAYPVAEQRLLAFQRNYSSKQKTHDYLLNKRIEAGIGAASQISFHKILEHASLPRRTIGMSRKVVLAIGLMVGTALGLMLILGIHYMRGPVMLEVEAEEAMTTPVLGVAPASKKLDAYVDLATLLTVIQKQPVQALASWGRKTKQTAIIGKLATGLGIIGKKVLIMYTNAGAEGQSLSEILRGDATPTTATEGYDYVSLGNTEAERLAVLHGTGLGEWLRSQTAQYDAILIDTPPLSNSKQALPLLTIADGVLSIVRKGVSKKANLKAMRKALIASEITQNAIIWTA
ncbi:MAG: exopolysaccharide transport family protein [Bacteroidia bacterium]